MNPLLIKSYPVTAVVAAYTIVAFSDAAASNAVAPAGAATDRLLGATGKVGVSEIDGLADVTLVGIGEVQLGGAVQAGDRLTSNANGKAVATTTAGDRFIGFALEPGAADEIIDYRAAPGVI